MAKTFSDWRLRGESPPADGAEWASGLPPLVWQMLYGRGHRDSLDIEALLKPSLKQLSRPGALKGMTVALDRLERALKNQERVAIYADFDLDGTSGLALLKDGLERLGFVSPIAHQPKRLTEGYGVHESQVEELFGQGVRLMITVDVGITANQALKRARELGIEVIVTDHHLPGAELPEALSIVNPNLPDCSSGLGHLSGVGVAFYLVLGLRAHLRERGLVFEDFDPKELLDCLVIGTLTDMVPLIKENRVLVKHGLVQLAATRRPGLRALMDSLDLSGRELSAQDVAIRFSPKLNALSRLETGLRPIDIFLVEDEAEARRMAEEVLALNKERVRLQKSGEELAFNEAVKTARGRFAWVHSDKFHRGVVGLIASRLCEQLGVPAFVGAESEDGRIVGSARVPHGSGVHLVRALEAAREHLVRHGGHPQAAGFELQRANADSFGHALNSYFETIEGTFEAPVLIYDAEGEIEEINPSLMRWLEGLGPFGSHFEPPKFLVLGARVHSPRELQGGHWRFELGSQRSTHRLPAVWFSPDPWIPIHEFSDRKALVEAVVEPEWNFFRGRKSLQVMIHSLREWRGGIS